MRDSKSKDYCLQCGTPVAESIKTSFDTFVEGYIYCWRCRTRIDLEVGQSGPGETCSDCEQKDPSDQQ